MPVTVPSPLTLLAIDDFALPLRRNLCLYISKPAVHPEPVVSPERDNADAPDNAAAHFYGGVVRDQGKYRHVVLRLSLGGGYAGEKAHDSRLGNLIEGPTCYAESDDGIHWVKPNLGQVEWRGNTKNNIIRLADLHTEGVHVILDAADPDPHRRYKMVYNYMPAGKNFWTIRTATSADGLHWTDGPELPFDGFIEQASLYRFGGMYFVNGQVLSISEGGHRGGRQGYAIVSPDFDHWLQESAPSFLLPEPTDPAARGHDKPYDQVHIGVGATSFGNVLVGLYGMWHNVPYPTKDDWFGMGATSCDLGLLVSHDGLHFREPAKGHVFIHRDESPVTVPPGLAHARILCQGNGILNVGEETRIYHTRWANTPEVKDYHGEVALAILQRDRWGALGLIPGAGEGSVWSAPITVPGQGGQVVMNADLAAGISVEVADERFGLLGDYSGENSGRVLGGGGLDCPVRWAGKTWAELAGRTVRLRLHLRETGGGRPRVYAVYVR